MKPQDSLDPANVQDYYGQVLQGSEDLQTNACCCGDECLSSGVRQALAEINDEVMARFYGCGSPLPPLLACATVLDLGCGSGRDSYVAARLAGPCGRVIGVDMTEAQLDVARRNLPSQMERFGYKKPNVDFRHGRIEDLAALGIADASVDVVISNCVLNLSADKARVFAEIFRVLKPGGELIFADVFADRRIPAALHGDPVLHGECLAGALYEEDFRRLMTRLGCPDLRVVTRRPLELGSEEIEAKIGMVGFSSVTVRAFKLEGLEDAAEDYGQVATYLGTIPDYPHAFALDDEHAFPTGKPVPVCGNTALMLAGTRYAPHFRVLSGRDNHFGLFSQSGGGCGCHG